MRLSRTMKTIVAVATAVLLAATASQSTQRDELTDTLYAVGTQGNLGVWNGTGWESVHQGWNLKQVTTDLSGQLWFVGTEGNVGVYDENENKIDSRGKIGRWDLNWLTFDNKGNMWAVGTASNVGEWNGTGWDSEGLMGGWTIKSIAFDDGGVLWAVGTHGNVGKWNGSGWDDKGLMGGWTIKSIAFDGGGVLWAVGTDGNVGKWNGSGWDNKGLMGGWTISSVEFRGALKVIDIEYDWDNKKEESRTETLGIGRVFKNDTGVEQTERFTFQVTKGSTATFSWSNATEIGVKMESEVKVPLVGKSKLELSVTNTYTFGEEHSNTRNETFSWDTPIKVPPRTTLTALARLSRGDLSLPFTATLEYKGRIVERKGIFKATGFFNTVTDMKTTPIQ